SGEHLPDSNPDREADPPGVKSRDIQHNRKDLGHFALGWRELRILEQTTKDIGPDRIWTDSVQGQSLLACTAAKQRMARPSCAARLAVRSLSSTLLAPPTGTKFAVDVE
ncbi:MAG: hypothetical protein QOF94_1590, partial [Acidobacteriaceae bacterium]